ncbi:hypothetical protein [Hymenobacter sp. BRD67]|uniref:hypothetical protein n=1 Tax=Hymenobacter sp. BRD67 TaxID=2675877 RepID=UPI001565267C|nr:hypothetical protein [Hymenobacter sp. BRD67]QKG52165.1 hypothetical protein GKZ67_05520 [Hymenobacter sp. BRD67]
MNTLKNTLLELQYQYSKLFVISIPRRSFYYEISDNQFIASNTSRNTLISIVFTAFASLLLLSGIIELCSKQVNITTDFVVVFFLVHPIIGLLAFRQFLWLVNGTEELIVENHLITLKRKGTFWIKSNSYQLDSIDFVRKLDWSNLPLYDKIQFNIRLNLLLIFKMTTGEISFNYQDKEIFFFSNLLENEKLLVVDQIVRLKHLSQKAL